MIVYRQSLHFAFIMDTRSEKDSLLKNTRRLDEEEEGDQQHNDDAFEWGRVAGAKLVAQNHPISLELPSALHNLFTSPEFREAMLVGGVLSDRITTTLPSIVLRRSNAGFGGGTFIPGSIIPGLRTSPRRKEKLLAIQDRRTDEEKGLDSSGDDEDDRRLTMLLPITLEGGGGSPVKKTADEDSRLPKIVDGDDDDLSPDGEPSSVDKKKAEAVFDELKCVTCQSQPISSSLDGDSTKSKKLKELLWCSVGLSDYRTKIKHPFPFCGDCCGKLNEMMAICEQVKKLEERFVNCRDNLTKGISVMLMDDKMGLGSAETEVREILQDSRRNIRPGRDLLKDVAHICGEDEPDLPDYETEEECSRSSDFNLVNNQDEDEYSEKNKSKWKRSVEKYGYTPAELRRLFMRRKSDETSRIGPSGRPSVSCPKCSKEYTTERSLKRHLEKHQNKEKGTFSCNLCTEKFETQRELHNHIKVSGHTKVLIPHKKDQRLDAELENTSDKNKLSNGSSFVCSVCEKAFCSRATLTCHRRVHTGEQPFKCPDCPKSFANKSNFTEHSRRHKGLKPYKCTVCDESFYRIRVILNHFKAKHPNEKVSYKRVL